MIQDTLVGCAGGIIRLNDLAANSVLIEQLKDGLEEVDVEAPVLVDSLEKGQGLLSFTQWVLTYTGHSRSGAARQSNSFVRRGFGHISYRDGSG